jgi:hypothetical protein
MNIRISTVISSIYIVIPMDSSETGITSPRTSSSLVCRKKDPCQKNKGYKKKIGIGYWNKFVPFKSLKPHINFTIGYQQKITFYPGLDKV